MVTGIRRGSGVALCREPIGPTTGPSASLLTDAQNSHLQVVDVDGLPRRNTDPGSCDFAGNNDVFGRAYACDDLSSR